MRIPHLLSIAVVVAALSAASFAQTPVQSAVPTEPFHYQRAPQIVRQALDSPATPEAIVAPTRDHLLLVEAQRNPPIADLAAPILRIGGIRINPETNGRHHPPRRNGLTLISLPDGAQQKIALPKDAWLGDPVWSADGQHVAFAVFVPKGIELWVVDAKTAAARKVPGVTLNGTYGRTFQWMPDQKSLLVQLVRANRGAAPQAQSVPLGPNAQETAGKAAPAPTYEDLLRNLHDEALFDYYCTAQLAVVDVASGRVTPIGKPGIFDTLDLSPDGKHILVARLHRPYSYLVPASEFPKSVEVWDLRGNVEHSIADLPSHEGVPIQGVPTGPRDYGWRATAPATLVWVEALDGGDPKRKADFRDRIVMLASPFSAQPVELAKIKNRLGGGFGGNADRIYHWGNDGLLIVSDNDPSRRWTRTVAINADQPGGEARVLWERSQRDRYNDPGNLVTRMTPAGDLVLQQNGNYIFSAGEGASPKGDVPFLARIDVTTGKLEKIFQSADKTFESVVLNPDGNQVRRIALLADDGSRFLTRFESLTDAPNFYLRSLNGERKKLTNIPDPAPALRGITKQIVTYKRADGVDLSFKLYLPAECGTPAADPLITCRKAGERLPTIVWAYPLEFSDASTAGQISGSPYRFTSITGYSQLWLVTQGYAVLDDATMPVIGDAETMNNTYVEQIVASAKAAIDKAVEMGVADRDRVGVGGHSYGAFMTANLLAHSDLFRAGVARSGAYNRTLTPFGFQSERRTFWQAPEMYMKVSPFAFADKIKVPILLIHGEADDNTGTFPIQSERMYAAIKGNGGTVRYVTLPYEAHGYLGRETTEHVVWEMITWFDRWVKNAPPKTPSNVAAER